MQLIMPVANALFSLLRPGQQAACGKRYSIACLTPITIGIARIA